MDLDLFLRLRKPRWSHPPSSRTLASFRWHADSSTVLAEDGLGRGVGPGPDALHVAVGGPRLPVGALAGALGAAAGPSASAPRAPTGLGDVLSAARTVRIRQLSARPSRAFIEASSADFASSASSRTLSRASSSTRHRMRSSRRPSSELCCTLTTNNTPCSPRRQEVGRNLEYAERVRRTPRNQEAATTKVERDDDPERGYLRAACVVAASRTTGPG